MSHRSKKPATSSRAVCGLFVGFSFLFACSDQTADSVSRLDADTRNCNDVEEICTQSEPPQCYDYCADDSPGAPGETCILLGDIDGNEVLLCGGDDCVVSYDADTGTETITCDGTGSGGSGEGSEPSEP